MFFCLKVCLYLLQPKTKNKSHEQLKALENQLASGTIPPDWTTEDILDSAFCAAEGIPFMVTKLITRWASAV